MTRGTGGPGMSTPRKMRAYQVSVGRAECDKMRPFVLDRDRHRCVRCAMTDEEHLRRFHRRITIDHVDKNRTNNSMDNLQTLCLVCHGRKDYRIGTVQCARLSIRYWRAIGRTYAWIGAELGGVDQSYICRWVKVWEKQRP